MKKFLNFWILALIVTSSLGASNTLAASSLKSISPLTVVQNFHNHFNNPDNTSLHFDQPTSEGNIWWIAPDEKNILIQQSPETRGYITPISITYPTPGTNMREFSPALQTFIRAADAFMFSKGFTLDTRNSSTNYQDDRFEDFVHAYTQGDIVCTLTVNPDQYVYDDPALSRTEIYFGCSDELQKYYSEQAPFLEALKSLGTDFVVYSPKRVENFVTIQAHGRRAGFYAILMQQTDGSYKNIYSGQDVPPCNLMKQYNVPKEIYGECGDYTLEE